jgi:hypothetical protein
MFFASAHQHLIASIHQHISTSAHQPISTSEHIIFKDNFNCAPGALPSKYWSEGCPGVIKDGHLFVDADTAGYRQSTIWLDQELSGDLIIECDVHVISSDKKANNINFMFLYSDPKVRRLKESRSERSNGEYKSYHQLNGYIFTYLADGTEDNARFRFRDNPGFNLINEVKGFECKTGRTYHIKIIKLGNRFQFWSNGFKAIDVILNSYNPPYDKGNFGFRTWHTKLWWDNLSIISK